MPSPLSQPRLTFAGLLSGDALGTEPLVQDVEHLAAQVEEQQRQRPARHGARPPPTAAAAAARQRPGQWRGAVLACPPRHSAIPRLNN